jgi:hypothetical protein
VVNEVNTEDGCWLGQNKRGTWWLALELETWLTTGFVL